VRRFVFVMTLCVATLASAWVWTNRDRWKLDRLIVEGRAYLEARRGENEATYHLSTYAHYDWSQDTGEIVFSSSGVPKVVASIQFVGDVSKRSRTWLWSWANDTVDERLKKAATSVRDLGMRENIDRLTRAQWLASETDGWDMTGLAAKHTRASGAYRTCGDSGCEFILLTNIRWAPAATAVEHSGPSR